MALAQHAAYHLTHRGRRCLPFEAGHQLLGHVRARPSAPFGSPLCGTASPTSLSNSRQQAAH